MDNKVYSFSTNDAIKYGVDSAILLHNIRYWLDHARANEQMIQDGYHWMFMTSSKMQSIMPFWSANKIQKMLKSLSDSGVLIVGEYNKSSWNRTNWYTMPEFKHSANSLNAISQTADSTFSQTADSHYDQYKDSNKVRDHLNYEEIMNVYNLNMPHKQVRRMNDTRKKLVKKFFDKTGIDMETYQAFVEHIANSPQWEWTRQSNVGANGVSYGARPFDYYMTEDNYIKVMEE